MSFVLRAQGDAYMCSYWLDLSNPAHRILYKFGLSARGKTELEILKKLSQGSANVYELKWKRLRDIDVHYSTVLRALRRLEKKKLVRVVSQKNSGRRGKTYACTLVGSAGTSTSRSWVARLLATRPTRSYTRLPTLDWSTPCRTGGKVSIPSAIAVNAVACFSRRSMY